MNQAHNQMCRFVRGMNRGKESGMRSLHHLLIMAAIAVCSLTTLCAAGGRAYKALRDHQQFAGRCNALVKIQQASEEYARDHNNHFPDAAHWQAQLEPYLGQDAAQAIGDREQRRQEPLRSVLRQALAGQRVEPLMHWLKSPPEAGATEADAHGS